MTKIANLDGDFLKIGNFYDQLPWQQIISNLLVMFCRGFLSVLHTSAQPLPEYFLQCFQALLLAPTCQPLPASSGNLFSTYIRHGSAGRINFIMPFYCSTAHLRLYGLMVGMSSLHAEGHYCVRVPVQPISSSNI